MKIKRFTTPSKAKVEVFSEKIKGRNIYFVSKITKKKIATGQARDKKHALAWAKRLK